MYIISLSNRHQSILSILLYITIYLLYITISNTLMYSNICHLHMYNQLKILQASIFYKTSGYSMKYCCPLIQSIILVKNKAKLFAEKTTCPPDK